MHNRLTVYAERVLTTLEGIAVGSINRSNLVQNDNVGVMTDIGTSLCSEDHQPYSIFLSWIVL